MNEKIFKVEKVDLSELYGGAAAQMTGCGLFNGKCTGEDSGCGLFNGKCHEKEPVPDPDSPIQTPDI